MTDGRSVGDGDDGLDEADIEIEITPPRGQNGGQSKVEGAPEDGDQDAGAGGG
jgi:hypothetical protein